MTLKITTGRLSEMAMRKQEQNPIITAREYMSDATLNANASSLNGTALANLKNGGTFDFWTPDTTGESIILIRADLGQERTVNFVGVAAHNLEGIESEVSVEYGDNGTDWTDISDTATVDSAGNVGLYFEDVTARWWRVGFTVTSGDDISIGVVHIGEMVTIPTRVYQGYTPPIQATNVQLLGNVTEGGNYVSTAVTSRGKSAGAEINYVKPEFIRGDLFQDFLRRFNDGKPVFWAWRPVKYEDLIYAWRSGGAVVPSNTGPNDLMGFGLSMRAYNDNP